MNPIEKEIVATIRHILETLLIVFIVLKLTGLVSWGWAYVLAPLWIPCFIAGILAGIYFAWKEFHGEGRP